MLVTHQQRLVLQVYRHRLTNNDADSGNMLVNLWRYTWRTSRSLHYPCHLQYRVMYRRASDRRVSVIVY